MAASRKIDIIAAIAIAAALVITVLFMNGEALGMQRAISGEETSLFTDNDLDADWNTAGAAQITLTGSDAEIEGSGAYFRDGNLIIYAAGKYVISGKLDNGSIIVDETSRTAGKVWILFNGVEVYCEDSAALDIEEADKVFLTLAEGTENVLSGGAEYSEEAVNANIRGTLFSRDDLTINGSGSLAVNGGYRHGIVCNDDLRITGALVTVNAAEDGIHANDSAVFADMQLEIAAGDDAVTVTNDEGTGFLTVESGKINITACREGLEAKTITINSGEIRVVFSDDGMNAGGTDSLLTINGGNILLVNEDGRDVDGLDSNGDIVINGGYIAVSVNGGGSNNAIDFGSESGGSCYINGGTVIAAGGSGMTEAMSGDSAQASVLYVFGETLEAGQTARLYDRNGKLLLEQEIQASLSSLILSSPEMKQGETYTLTVGETEYEIELTEMSTTYGQTGFGGMGGHGGMKGGMNGGMGGDMNSTMDGAMKESGAMDGRGGMFGRGRQGQQENAGGQMPERPEGFDGQMPEPPEGFGGQMPERPEGFDGQMPEAREAFDGQTAQTPAEYGGQGNAAGEFRRGRGGFGGPMQEMQQENAGMTAEELRTALMITGAAFLVLLAGIGAAAKTKNRKNIA